MNFSKAKWSITFITINIIFRGIVSAENENNSTSYKIGPMLVRVVPKTPDQLQFLSSLRGNSGSLKMQLWRHPDKINQHVDIWISQSSFKEFEELCMKFDLSYEIISNDINKEFNELNVSMNNIEMFDQYYQVFDDIVGELKRLTTVFKNQTTLSVIGKSFEGRNLYCVHIHNNRTMEKPIIFINCGVHAREWLSVSSCKYILRKILFDQKYDHRIQNMLKHYDVMIVPLLNPDGYVVTHKRRFRLWRKSRSTEHGRSCVGVDLNRNFDYRWGAGGSSPDLCEDIYCGQRPFSESETRSLAQYLYKHRRRLVAYLDIHTYGQLWMSPWGFTRSAPKGYEKHYLTMQKIQRALHEEAEASYRIGRSALILYYTSGDSIDWVYGRLGVLHTYGIELRPRIHSRYGFRAPRHHIIPTGNDLLVGLLTLSRVMIDDENAKY